MNDLIDHATHCATRKPNSTGEVIALIGNGYSLRMGNGLAALVPRPRWVKCSDVIEIPMALVENISMLHGVAELPEDDWPPVAERNKYNGHIVGWRASGLPEPQPGEKYYRLVQ